MTFRDEESIEINETVGEFAEESQTRRSSFSVSNDTVRQGDWNIVKALLGNPTRFRYFRLIVFPDPRAFRLKNITEGILDMHGETPRP